MVLFEVPMLRGALGAGTPWRRLSPLQTLLFKVLSILFQLRRGGKSDLAVKQAFLCCCEPLPARWALRDGSLARVCAFLGRLESNSSGTGEHQGCCVSRTLHPGVTEVNGVMMFDDPTPVVCTRITRSEAGFGVSRCSWV